MLIERREVTNRELWLRWRREDLTASDIAAAAGFDPRRSPFSVYAEKTGMVEPEVDNALMRRGRWLEPAVLAALREQQPTWRIRPANVYLRDPDSRLGATPDAVAVVPDIGLVNAQLKVVSRPVFERDWADGVPIYYEIQTIVEGLLTEAKMSVIAALVIDTFNAELVIREVPRHEGAEQRAVEIAREFWERVAAQKPPMAQYDMDADLLRSILPAEVEGRVIDLSTDNRIGELLDQRERLSKLESQAKKELKAINAEVGEKIGDAESAIVPGWRTITYKTQHRKAYEVAATSFRVLRAVREEVDDDE